jgi:hypothetical protein
MVFGILGLIPITVFMLCIFLLGFFDIKKEDKDK